jgi:hypothetical protein
VSSRDAEQQRRGESRRAHSGGKTNGQADHDRDEALAHDEPADA